MSFESELADLMPDTVTYEPVAVDGSGNPTLDGYGKRTFQASKSVQCRIEQFAKLVTAQDGREVVSNTRVYTRPLAVDGSAIFPRNEDRFTLPAGYRPSQPPVISVGRANDEAGLHHWEISF